MSGERLVLSLLVTRFKQFCMTAAYVLGRFSEKTVYVHYEDRTLSRMETHEYSPSTERGGHDHRFLLPDAKGRHRRQRERQGEEQGEVMKAVGN